MPVCELQSESRMRENRTSGLTSGDGRRSQGNWTPGGNPPGRHWPPGAYGHRAHPRLYTGFRADEPKSSPGGALRPRDPQSTLNRSTRTPVVAKCRQRAKGGERRRKTAEGRRLSRPLENLMNNPG